MEPPSRLSPPTPDEGPLRDSADRLERVLRGSADGWWEWQLSTNTVHYSERWWEMLGYPPEERAATGGWRGLCHPDDLPVVDSLVRGLAGNDTEFVETEFRVRHRKGDYRVVLVRAMVERDDAGLPVRLSGLNRDVTAQRAVEHALRESEQHLRRLFESMNSGFSLHEIIRDANGTPCDYRFLEVNSAFEKLTGLRREDLIGRRVLEVLPATEPYWIERFCRVAVTGETDRFQNYSRELGRHYEVACYAPKPGQFAVLTFDVTERVKHEEAIRERETRFLRLIENASDLITIVDVSGLILYQSPSIERALGFPATEITGQDLFLLVHPEDIPAAGARFQEAILQPGLTMNAEFRLRHRNGQWRDFAAVGTSITGAGQVVINSRDVTEQRALETALRQSQKMEAVGRLSGGIAHDFNNLLTALKGYSTLLQGSAKLGAEELGYVREIHAVVDRAAGVTKQLLAFSRQQAVALRPVQLNQLVSSMFALLQHMLGETVHVELRLAAAELPVLADTGMIEQVLLNLAINARDAMPDGGRLTVTTERRELTGPEAHAHHAGAVAGSYARLALGDNGRGIAPDVLPRIFEPFFTTKAAGHGTGLGLAMVHGIVHQHCGWISVRSTVDQGTTFEIYLPIHHAAVTAGSVDAPVAAPAPAPLGRAETILVVEDEAVVRDLVNLVLKRQGYRTLTAVDGFEGLVLWRQHRDQINLLLTDVVMPGGLGGYEMARRILQDNPRLPVICMSGYLPTTGQNAGAAPEGAILLRKPFAPAELTALIRNALDGVAS
jgi:two-component system, cell cycle sensor histidine kinase and response regulator CckA